MKLIPLIISIIMTTSLIFLFSCDKYEETESYPVIDLEILQFVNQHRQTIGKSNLVMNPIIWKEARQHSKNMAEGTVPFGHEGAEERITRTMNIIGGESAGENVAMGNMTGREVVDCWLKSFGHKANIELDFTLTGVSAVKNSTGSWYYTQIFLKK